MGLKSQVNTKLAGHRCRMLGCRRWRLDCRRRKRNAAANDGRGVGRGERVRSRSPRCLLAIDEITVAERDIYMGDNIVAAKRHDQKRLCSRSSVAPALCSAMRHRYSVRSRRD